MEEKMIFAVMDKELRVIVWFGALLGCVIGAFSACFDNLTVACVKKIYFCGKI